MTDFQVGDRIRATVEGVVAYVGVEMIHLADGSSSRFRTMVSKDSVTEVLERGVYTDPAGTIRQPHDSGSLYIATLAPGRSSRWLLLGGETWETHGDDYIIELDTFVLDRIVAREVDA